MKYVVLTVIDNKAFLGDLPTNKAKAERWAKANRKSGFKSYAVKYEV